ncbi:hypothetical protein [Chishuiella sp.]|uniref:hypothetical protein n=1 Tax=Chishuiella sp. TaxID=1969467 RepID=UPI0028A9EF5A|nr:hypothetical protein [Chishuiella sp.]
MIDNTELLKIIGLPIDKFNEKLFIQTICDIYSPPNNNKKIKIDDKFRTISEDSSKSTIVRYIEKLQLWRDEELSPFETQYYFTIENFHKQPVLSIFPNSEDKKVEYIKWLVNYLNDIIYNKYKRAFDFKTTEIGDLVYLYSKEEIIESIYYKLGFIDDNLYEKYLKYKLGNFSLIDLKIDKIFKTMDSIYTLAIKFAFLQNELEAIYSIENSLIVSKNNKLLNNRTFRSNLNEVQLGNIFENKEVKKHFSKNQNQKEEFIKLFSNERIENVNLIWTYRNSTDSGFIIPPLFEIIQSIIEFNELDWKKTYNKKIINIFLKSIKFDIKKGEKIPNPHKNFAKGYIKSVDSLFEKIKKDEITYCKSEY